MRLYLRQDSQGVGESDLLQLRQDMDMVLKEEQMTVKPVANPQSDAATIAELKRLGFSDEIVEAPRRLIVSSKGTSKCGKTHFALSGPPPIIFFNIDIGTEGVVGKFQEAGKQVLIYDVRVPREASQDVYVPLWVDLKNRILKAYSLREGTVVWDTSTEAFELARLAKFGKLSEIPPQYYAAVNNEWRELLRTAYDSKMNTVFIHKLKPVWQSTTTSTGKRSSYKTDRFELAGFSEMEYLAQLNLTHYREDTESGTVFSVVVDDSRHTPGIAGTVLRGLPLASGEKRVDDPMCNFEMLLSLVHDK